MKIINSLPLTASMIKNLQQLLNAELQNLHSLLAQFKDSATTRNSPFYEKCHDLYDGIVSEYQCTCRTAQTNEDSLISGQFLQITALHKKLDDLYEVITQELLDVIYELKVGGLSRKNLSIITSNFLEVKTSLSQLLILETLPYYSHHPEGKVLERISDLYEGFSLILDVDIEERNHGFFFLDVYEEISSARKVALDGIRKGLFSSEAMQTFTSVLAEKTNSLRLLDMIAYGDRLAMDYLTISQNLYDFLSSVRRVSFNPKYLLAILDGMALSDIERLMLNPKRKMPDIRWEREAEEASTKRSVFTLFPGKPAEEEAASMSSACLLDHAKDKKYV